MSQTPPYPPTEGPGWSPPGPAPEPGAAPGWGPPGPPPAAPGWDPGPAPAPAYGAPPGAPPSAPPGPGYGPQPGFPPQPGYGGPPGFGPQPGGPGGPPAGTKRSPLVPILIVLVLVAGGVGAYFALAGGDDSGPEAVADRYFDALLDRDCDAMVDTLALGDQSREEALSECQGFVATMGDGDLGPEVAELMPVDLVSTDIASESGSEATIDVEYRTQGGATETVQIVAVKDGGDWKIDPDRSFDVGTSTVPSDDLEPSDDTVPPPDDPPDDGGDGGSGDVLSDPPIDSQEAIDNPALVSLAVSCSQGDMAACDDLWLDTDVGGELEAYAETCGGRAPGGGVEGDCELQFG